MKQFRSKKKIRSSILYKYIFIIILFYIIIKICINLVLKIPIELIFNNYKINKYKEYIISHTLKKPNNMLMYYKETKETLSSVSYVYNTIPLVYIYDTHQKESYIDGYTVLDSAKVFKEELSKYNVETIVEEQDITEFMNKNNIPFDRSYYGSSFFVKDAISKYNFSLIIDLHRDGTSKDVSTTNIDGISYAKILFIVGKNNDHYELNYSLALKLNELIKAKYPTLSRGVWLRDGTGERCKYNQYLSSDMILLELGGDKNTFDEVKNTITLLAPIIGDYLYE